MVIGKTTGRRNPEKTNPNKIPNLNIPLFSRDPSAFSLDSIRQTATGVAPGNLNVVNYTISINGQNFVVPSDFLLHGSMLSKELRAYRLMGAKSILALQVLLGQLATDTSIDATRKQQLHDDFLNYIVASATNNGIANTRKIVMALAADPNNANFIAYLEAVNADNRPFLKKVNGVAFKKYSEPDRDIPEFEEGKESPLQPPAFSAGSIPDGPSYEGIALQMDALMAAVSKVNNDRRAANPAYVPPTLEFSTLAAVNPWLAYDATGTDAVVASITALNNARATIANTDVSNAWFEGVKKWYFDQAAEPSLSVKADPMSIASSPFHRTPLTMTLRLLQTAAQEETPLIRPGDPDTGYSTPFGFDVDARDQTSLPTKLWERPEYATISNLAPQKKIALANINLFARAHKSVRDGEGESMDTINAITQKQVRIAEHHSNT